MRIQRQVGLNVRRLRLAREQSQQTVAAEARISMAYVSGIEVGKRNPTADIIGRLARALGAQPADLFAPVSESDPLPKNLKRGPNVHHQGRKLGVKRTKRKP